MIGGCYCILHALGNKKLNFVVFNLADFRNSPNCQNKFHPKFSFYTVLHCDEFVLFLIGFLSTGKRYKGKDGEA